VKLTEKQNEARKYLLDSSTREILYGGSAGSGKSFLGNLFLINGCLRYPHSRWLMGRSQLKTLKQTTLKTFFEVASKLGLHNGVDYRYKANESIHFYNGSEIILKDLFAYPSDPDFDGLGSLEITGAFVDEASQITEKCYDVLRSRIRYGLKKYGVEPKILLTCNPTRNWIFERFYKPFEENRLDKKKAFIPALPDDNPNLPQSYIDSLKGMKSDALRQRLLYGNWYYDNDPQKIFDPEALSGLVTVQEQTKGRKYITADVARFGGDKTVVVTWHGWHIHKIHVIEKSGLDEVWTYIQEEMKRENIARNFVIVDEDGAGGGVVDTLHSKGFQNGSRAKDPTKYANLKSECYIKLAEKINGGFCSLGVEKHHEIIKYELGNIRIENPDKERKLRIESKDTYKSRVGHSPDFADAIMMRSYWELFGFKQSYSFVKFGK
jgi:PBSX family phage terminase large subunit